MRPSRNTFNIDLISEVEDLDLEAVLAAPAALVLDRDDAPLPIHGILESFEQRGQSQYATHYHAVLRPRLWLLTIHKQSQIYQNSSIPDIIETEIKNIGLTGQDYEFRLSDNYPPKEYIVQYNQTDLAFLSFLMERDGIFYFFEQTENGEKLIIADTPGAFKPIPEPATILYRTASGMETVDEESVQVLTCRQRRRPRKFILKDYNYRKPSLDLRVEYPDADASVSDGMISEYGDHYLTPEEGRCLARIRAEEHACRERMFLGESDCVAFHSGATYTLGEHYRTDVRSMVRTPHVVLKLVNSARCCFLSEQSHA